MVVSKTLKSFHIGQLVRPWEATLYKKWNFFLYFGAAFPPPVAIEVKFCTAKRTHVHVGPAKFELNRCNESPLRGDKPDFWPVSKSNTDSLPLRGILPVISSACSQLNILMRHCIRCYCRALFNAGRCAFHAAIQQILSLCCAPPINHLLCRQQDNSCIV